MKLKVNFDHWECSTAVKQEEEKNNHHNPSLSKTSNLRVWKAGFQHKDSLLRTHSILQKSTVWSVNYVNISKMIKFIFILPSFFQTYLLHNNNN